MKKNLKDYAGQKIAILMPTKEDWLRRKEINPSDAWLDESWDKNREKTCYYPFDEGGAYSGLEFAKEEGYIILNASEFLEDEFVYLQEYEFSDDEDFKKYRIARFGCKYPKDSQSENKFIAFNENGYSETFKYCRKINTEKTEAIAKIKELVAKFNIDKNEIYGTT